MVKAKNLDRFFTDVMELFGFLFAQEIAKSPLTPKDTTRMSKSFGATYKFNRSTKTFSYTTPFYTMYVHEGTAKMKARPFIIDIFHRNSSEILKKSFKIKDKEYKTLGL